MPDFKTFPQNMPNWPENRPSGNTATIYQFDQGCYVGPEPRVELEPSRAEDQLTGLCTRVQSSSGTPNILNPKSAKSRERHFNNLPLHNS